ncbi:TonB-dependent receptor [Persicobacter diffluens]|uniref:TonB-dependent receptor n=1 Tax=Persicobacter diffluens TaxID=981 RepID=A0AAN5AKS4_9BACT|nr:hypothetical protein PEDI_26640 [Persicobacter diffluens]
MNHQYYKNFIVLLIFVFAVTLSFGQGSTTSSMNGRVTDENGDALPGATVVATDTRTGAEYGSITDFNGFYRINGMSVGGPYKLEVSFVGYDAYLKVDLFLTLGQTFKVDVAMGESVMALEGVEVTASAEDDFDGNRTGAQTVVGSDKIEALPTVARDLNDFTRLTPQAKVDNNGGLSIAGINNRYNAIFIDGAVNNDVFGLSSQGTNGGQTGISPVSIDAIEQFQVVIAPYDVRQGGFAGGGINAVTRSGSNQFEGSAYWLFRNQNIAGKTPTDDPNVEREKLSDFSAQTYGARLGGPIIKNKLFFFANVEIQRDETPQPYNPVGYLGDTDAAGLDDLRQALISRYDYDPGDFRNNTQELRGEKFLLRFDYNINRNHKLTARHSYTKGEALQPDRSSNTSISYFNAGRTFPSVTNSTAIELNSNFGSKFSNNLILGYTHVLDDRTWLGGAFPSVQITDGAGRITFGSEPFSTANKLEQDIFTITDNFSIYKGRHTITIGTHNEFYKLFNLFVRQNFGEYSYNSVADFLTGDTDSTAVVQYRRGYSILNPPALGNENTTSAADFNAMQLGFYVQDEIEVNDKLKVTAGLRVDIPIYTDDPIENTKFNQETLPQIAAAGWDVNGVKSGQLFKVRPLFAPRVGFNFDVFGNQTTQLRGGTGIFNSRIPLVWLGGAYTNTGLSVGTYTADDRFFDPDISKQPPFGPFPDNPEPSGQMDLFRDDFKLPQVWRSNLAVDQKLPAGLVATVEFMYTKTLNDVVYKNLNVSPNPSGNLEGPGDQRPFYDRANRIDADYTDIILGENTSKGHSYNISATIKQSTAFGLDWSLSYTYGQSKVLTDGTSSQNSSQWRFTENVNGKNNLDLSFSDFDPGHRIVGFVSYRKEYLKSMATTISLFGNAESGKRFSYVYGGSTVQGTDGTTKRGTGQIAFDDPGSSTTTSDLIYVPRSADEINLIDYVQDGRTITAEEQWEQLDAYIRGDDYLSERRGDYVERNGDRLPFTFTMDLKLAQEFFINTNNGRRHKLTVSFDIFNFTNFLNKDWGRKYFMSFDQFPLIRNVGGEGTDRPEFIFNTPSGDIWNIDDSGVNGARWQAQLGVRYTF